MLNNHDCAVYLDPAGLIPPGLSLRQALAARSIVWAAPARFENGWFRYYSLSSKISYLLTLMMPEVPLGDAAAITADAVARDRDFAQLIRVLLENKGWDLQLVPGSIGHCTHDKFIDPFGAVLSSKQGLTRFLFSPNSYVQMADTAKAPPRMMPTDRGGELTYADIFGASRPADVRATVIIRADEDTITFENGAALPLSDENDGWSQHFVTLIQSSVVYAACVLRVKNDPGSLVAERSDTSKAVDITEPVLDFLTDYVEPWSFVSRLTVESFAPRYPVVGSDIEHIELKLLLAPDLLPSGMTVAGRSR